MSAVQVVPALDPLEHRDMRLALRLETRAIEQLALERREEALRHRVVEAFPRAGAEEKASFGFSLYGMKSLKLSEALKHCAEIGYDGVELALMSGWPCDPATLRGDARAALAKQLNDSGLALLGLMENLPWVGDGRHQAWVLDRLRQAAELGSREAITGDFLLDPEFVRVPDSAEAAPLVLLD